MNRYGFRVHTHRPADRGSESHISVLLQVVEEYNRRDQEIKQLEKELEEKTNALEAYRQNISEVLIYSEEKWVIPCVPI